jgi:uncharacterized membrane protein YphA (DoxX/SURF4 family)
LRRLFSTFARGWPGVGLLLMRLVTGIALIDAGVTKLWGGPPFGPTILCVIVGLWTPIAGLLLVVIEVWKAFSHPGDPWTRILLATLGAALALLGPGAWSVDARLFGWKRIDIRDRKR